MSKLRPGWKKLVLGPKVLDEVGLLNEGFVQPIRCWLTCVLISPQFSDHVLQQSRTDEGSNQRFGFRPDIRGGKTSPVHVVRVCERYRLIHWDRRVIHDM
jgi:hypothetical protein